MVEQPSNEDLNILQSAKYINFKNQSQESIRNSINEKLKPPVSKYENKIKRTVHNLVQSTNINDKLKKFILLEYQPRYHLYKKLYKQLIDRHGFYMSELEFNKLLVSLNPDFEKFIDLGRDSHQIEDRFQEKIMLMVDASLNDLKLDSLEATYLNYKYSNVNFMIQFDDYGRIVESEISNDILTILKFQNLKYSLEGRLSNMRWITATHQWNQIAIHLCYEITKTNPILYTKEQENEYLSLKNTLNQLINFYDELIYLVNNNKINLINYIYLLILKYRSIEVNSVTNMFHLDKQYYKSRIISDIELYHPSLFTDLSQNLIQFSDFIVDLFEDMKPFLVFPAKHNDLQQAANSLLGYSIQLKSYESLVDLTPPYQTILKNMKYLNENHLRKMNISLPFEIRNNLYSLQDIYLDIYLWKDIPNFFEETYFDYLFLNIDLNIIHKYILFMKGTCFFPIQKDLEKYLVKNFRSIIGVDFQLLNNKKYKGDVELNTFWNANFTSSLISNTEEPIIYQVIYNQSNDLYIFIDFMIQYLLIFIN